MIHRGSRIVSNCGVFVAHLQLDEALLEQQREAYAVAGESETVAPAQEKKKRKKNENVRVTAPNSNPHLAEIGYTILTEFETIQDSAGNSKKQRQNDQPKAERKNTAVYVTSLPLDVTVDELNSTFSKYGVIAEEIDSGGPRIKLYQDENGKPKGDALIVYFRPESVQLAIQMLDDSDFRLGQEGPMGKMRVKEADWSYKKQKEAGGADNGDKQTSKEKRDKAREKQKIIKRTQKLNSKLADWDDDDPSALPDTSSRWDKVVILKHMFTLKELEV